MKKLSIFLSLLLLLTACGKSDDVEQTVAPNTPDTPGGVVNGHEYVNLGLPSGTLWATTNVGAAAPEEYGDYFAWGETEPKNIYEESSYKWYNGSLGILTKYNTEYSYGPVDNKTVLEAADDAATVNWGRGWRMPTLAEWKELETFCAWTKTELNGVSGRFVVGPNTNYIFLPTAGYRSRFSTTSNNTNNNGYYWTSSLNSDVPSYAYNQYSGWAGHYIEERAFDRPCGLSVRPVRASAPN